MEIHFECAAIEIKVKSDTKRNHKHSQKNFPIENLIIITIYRSNKGDSKTFFRQLEIILNNIISENKKIILLGDFNINSNPTNKTEEKLNKDLLNLLATYELDSTIHQTTRHDQYHNKDSSIDKIITNIKQSYSSTIVQSALSDHNAQQITIEQNILQLQNETKLIRKYTKEKKDSFRQELKNTKWNTITNTKCPNEAYNKLGSILTTAFTSHFPETSIKVKKSHKNPKWITQGIKISGNNLKSIYSIARHFPHSNFITNYYKTYKHIYRKTIEASKRMDTEQRITSSKNISKSTWNIIKENTNKLEKVKKENIELEIDNKIETNGNIISNTFNKFFATIATRIQDNTNKTNNMTYKHYLNKTKSPQSSIYLYQTNEDEIKETTRLIKSKTSTGIDLIPINLVQECIIELATPLKHIFNLCLDEGTFPDKLKIAKIIPILKKGNNKEINNYRPIALLPAISKIFEKILAIRITNFLEKQNTLSTKQNGFRKGKNTIDTIEKFVNKISNSLDKGTPLIGIFCDLSKAFDCVNHQILLEKLHHYGIRGKPHKLLQSYLSNRQQYTEITMKNSTNTTKINSEMESTEYGVPQGSILGPLLFIIYINDLPNIIEQIEIFADDTSILAIESKTHSLKDSAELELEKATKWLQANKLILNETKTTFIHFISAKKEKNTVQIEELTNKHTNSKIQNSTSTQFLGLGIDSKLTWKPHIENLTNKLNSACFAIRQIRNISNIKTAKIVYNSYFKSHLSYGITLWGTSPLSQQIFKIQKRAIRTIVKANPRTSCKPIFTHLKILSLYSLYIYEAALLIRKKIHTMRTRNHTHQHMTRRNNELEQNYCNTKKGQLNSEYIKIQIYNKLPENIKTSNSTNIFKKRLTDFLAKEQFYSINEFLHK
jgi:Reverse transcriptase (RNA-dependent DNA polymerase)